MHSQQWIDVFLRLNHILKCWSWLSLPIWTGALMLPLLLKLPPRKLEFLFYEVALYLYKSTLRPCMEYCYHVCGANPSCYLKLIDKLQKLICKTIELVVSLTSLAHRRNVFRLGLFYRYYFGRCSSKLTQLVPLPYSRGWSTHYSDRMHDYSVTIPQFYKHLNVNGFFLCTTRLWNSLTLKCFPLTYGLNGYKSRIKRHLLTVDSFRFPVFFNLFALPFLVASCLVVAV